MSITDLTSQQLRQAADLQEKIQELQAELNQLLGGEASVSVITKTAVAPEAAAEPKKHRRSFSAETRAKMAAAQKARWTVKRGGEQEASQASTTTEPAPKPQKKQVSDALLKALAKARETRWAKVRTEKGTVKPEPKAKKRRKISAAGGAAMSAAGKARWAKTRAEKAAA